MTIGKFHISIHDASFSGNCVLVGFVVCAFFFSGAGCWLVGDSDESCSAEEANESYTSGYDEYCADNDCCWCQCWNAGLSISYEDGQGEGECMPDRCETDPELVSLARSGPHTCWAFSELVQSDNRARAETCVNNPADCVQSGFENAQTMCRAFP